MLSAYRDNAAVIRGSRRPLLPDPSNSIYTAHPKTSTSCCKVETHNHPTRPSPLGPARPPAPAAKSATKAPPAAAPNRRPGLSGFTVSNLRLPQAPQPWETPYGKPDHIASPLDIMIEGPLGAAAFNNEFGRPNLCGYFRTFEQTGPEQAYTAPASAITSPSCSPAASATSAPSTSKRAKSASRLRPHRPRRPRHAHRPRRRRGSLANRRRNPRHAASNRQPHASAGPRFASVQRDNAEMERRAQEVIDRCWQLGPQNPIAFIHDVGAGGLSNAFPELVKDGGMGGTFSLAAIPAAEAGLSPLEIWCNEAQERYVLAVAPADLPPSKPSAPASAAPTPWSATPRRKSSRHPTQSPPPPPISRTRPPHRPPDVPPLRQTTRRCERRFTRTPLPTTPLDLTGITIADAVERLLRLPTIGSKNFLITIGDRSVGGLVVQDQMVGPWQVPVADCAVTMRSFAATISPTGPRGPR